MLCKSFLSVVLFSTLVLGRSDIANDLRRLEQELSTMNLGRVDSAAAGESFASVKGGKDAVVALPQGELVGEDLGSYRRWLGVPFAEAPTGLNRFTAPRAIRRHGRREVKEFGPGCPQVCKLPDIFCPKTISEDCLQLNIFSPPTSSSLAPVVVFIPGGAFYQGAAGVPVYEGRKFAEKGVVMVTINYRLGVLGFLSGFGAVPNRAILDQRLALEWVRANISKFGGDASRVTLAGESAGAASTAIHAVSDKSVGLFKQIIMQSNPWTLSYRDLQSAQKTTKKLLDELECKDLACLANVEWNKLVTVAQGIKVSPNLFDIKLDFFLKWAPVVDGVELKEQVVAAFLGGKASRYPMILGSNTDEGEMFARVALKTKLNSLAYTAGVTLAFGARTLRHYPARRGSGEENLNRQQVGRLLTDFVFKCPTRKIAASSGARKAFLYSFDKKLTPGMFSALGPAYAYCEPIVCHGTELPFVFGTIAASGLTATPIDTSVSATMVNLWTSFAATGTPMDGPNVWQPYSAFSSSRRMNFNDLNGARMVEKETNSVCDFWDEKGYDM